MERNKLTQYLNDFLQIDQFEDYGPNGLQVEGSVEVERVAFSVSATVESALGACEGQAQALIVHHGLFWHSFGTRVLVGAFKKRVAPLLSGKINLYGYHLPLDAHREVGNAAGLAQAIEMEVEGPFGDYKGSPTGVWGQLSAPMAPGDFRSRLEKAIGREAFYSAPEHSSSLKTIGIITGGAGSDWPLALDRGLDAYITGEMSEHHWHDSRESGLHMFAGGHHATERFGVLALKKHLEEKFSLDCFFVDSQNPV